MDDAELVSLVLAGEREAYAQLVGRHAAHVHALCRCRVRSTEDAEELAQEALYRGLRDLASLHDPARFGAWVCSIARNVCRNWQRDRRHAEVPFTDCTANGRPDSALDRPCDEAPEVDPGELLAAVEALPVEYREAVVMYYCGGGTYRDLAARLEVSVSTVNVRLARARELLRRRLRRGNAAPP